MEKEKIKKYGDKYFVKSKIDGKTQAKLLLEMCQNYWAEDVIDNSNDDADRFIAEVVKKAFQNFSEVDRVRIGMLIMIHEAQTRENMEIEEKWKKKEPKPKKKYQKNPKEIIDLTKTHKGEEMENMESQEIKL